MKNHPIRRATDFPKISTEKLCLILETCRLPRKAQNLPEQARIARVMAMRLQHAKATYRHDKSDGTKPGSDWENIVDLLTAGLKKGDFTTLDHFCEGWIQTQAEARKVEAVEVMEITMNGVVQPSSPVTLSIPANNPGVKIDAEIAGAIISLQRILDRPPYPQEVVDRCGDIKRGLAIADVSNADISVFLKRWDLKGALPNKRKNPL